MRRRRQTPVDPVTERASDAQLLRAVAAEDMVALRLLYLRHAPWVRLRLMRRCADADVVDAAVQDTFVAVWRGARTTQLLLLVFAPVLPVLAVATAYGPPADAMHEITSTTPTAGPSLVLWRAAAVVGLSVGMVLIAAVALPGPGWWAATWLLPAFLLCVGTLALATVLPLATAAGLLGGLWLLAALAVGAFAPLVHVALFGPAAQFGYLAAAVVAIAFLALRSAPCGAQARTSGGESSWPTPAARSWSWPARSYSSATSRPPVTGYLRIRQVVLLTVPVARMVPWAPAAAAVVLSLLACLPALAGAAAPASQVWALRIAAFLLGAGACFALVGPLAPVSATPTPRWLRQWLRTVIALTPAVAVWLALFSLAAYSVPGHRLPFAELAAEASVCGLTGVAGTAVAARRGHSLTTALAGPAAQGGLVAATLFLAGDHSPWLLPTPAAPPTLHDRWIAAVPVPILVLGVANLEPWRRTILSMFPAR